MVRYQRTEIVNARFTTRERRPLNDNSIKKGRLAEAAARPCTHKSRLVSSGWSMSTLLPKADIHQRLEYVCFVPEADIRRCGSNDTPLLINKLNLGRHVRYETNAIA